MTAEQTKIYEILETFTQICEDLGLKYYLVGGTLLGAARHKGFIPWDDDIDVAMPQEDFERFLSYAQNFADRFELQAEETDEQYPHLFAKFCNTDIPFEADGYRGPKGAYIDIFPLIETGKPNRKLKGYFHLILLISYVLRIKTGWAPNIPYKNKKARMIFGIVKLLPVPVLREIRHGLVVWLQSSKDGTTLCSPGGGYIKQIRSSFRRNGSRKGESFDSSKAFSVFRHAGMLIWRDTMVTIWSCHRKKSGCLIIEKINNDEGKNMNIALIFAGGTGQRMNTKSRPKQFLELHGKPIIVYTLEVFETHEDIDGIVVVCLAEWIPYMKDLVEKYHLQKIKNIVPGGETGQESIYNGLEAISCLYAEDDIILVHDGVRPLIDSETITKNIRCATEKGNAITTTPAIETIVVENEAGNVGDILNRSMCRVAKAPQSFRLGTLMNCHKAARVSNKNNFIDSASMAKYYGHELYTVEGNVENIKITTPMDFYVFRALVDIKEESQIFGL